MDAQQSALSIAFFSHEYFVISDNGSGGLQWEMEALLCFIDSTAQYYCNMSVTCGFHRSFGRNIELSYHSCMLDPYPERVSITARTGTWSLG
jgi:hypothetical protein